MLSLVALGAGASEPSSPTPAEASTAAACRSLVPSPWPASIVERRLHLRRMDVARSQCIGNAEFLAAFGALLLEEGNAEEARTWLERALMLEPDSAGALADHALALAALGETTAAKELVQAWRTRIDVPPAVRQRLRAAADPASELRLPAGRLGLVVSGARMSTRGDASILLGYENNLGIAPRLTELELTPPEGAVVLPVSSVPRRGAAVRSDLSWQAAWELSQRLVLRSGLGVNARTAFGNAQTNWHQLTAALGVTQRWGDWSAVAQIDGAWFGGALTEPYALVRARFALDLATENCGHSVQLDVEERRQSRTRSADARATQLSVRAQCRPFGLRDWQLGLQLRAGVDRPDDPERPGGTQRSEAGAIRLEYRPSALAAVDLSVGTTRIVDGSGYSSLLENNAVRRQRQEFMTVEFSRTLDLTWMPGAEFVLQVTRFRQASNLPLFRHQGTSGYAGMRWPW